MPDNPSDVPAVVPNTAVDRLLYRTLRDGDEAVVALHARLSARTWHDGYVLSPVGTHMECHPERYAARIAVLV